MSSDLLLRDQSVQLGYHGRAVLSGLEGEYRRGERWVLTGSNGCGKSTFLKAVVDPSVIQVGRRDVGTRRDKISYMPQSHSAEPALRCTARDFLLASLMLTLGQRAATDAELLRTDELLRRTGLWEQADEPVGCLSGGQRQRLLFARALLLDAEILLLDEPFSGVDSASKEILRELLDETRPSTLQLIVSHDPEDFVPVNTPILRIDEGRVNVVPRR